MKKIVISQPMLFPWVGMFEQIRLSDTFIYYDDVQFSKGSLTNRVQLKNETDTEWMTIPLGGFKLGQTINNLVANEKIVWKKKHLDQLSRCYKHSIYFDEMMQLVESVYSTHEQNIAKICISSMNAICEYFDFSDHREFFCSSELGIKGSSSQRVVDIVLAQNGKIYITGHGAKHYLAHELFEKNQIRVEYINYEMKPYSQLYGSFTPYVSILDLIANEGRSGRDYIVSKTKYWQDFLNE